MHISKRLVPIAVSGILAVQTNVVFANDFTTEASATLVSQYIWRGFDLNQEDPAIQGDVIVNHESGIWVGAWGSNYDVGIDDGVEVDLMVGYNFNVNDRISVDLGVNEYTYSGDTESSTEFYVGLNIDQFSFSYFDDTDLDATYLSLDAEFELTDKFSFQIHFGDYDVDAGGSNNDYSLGLSYAMNDKLSLFGLYSDNDLDVEGAEDYFVIGGTYAF